MINSNTIVPVTIQEEQDVPPIHVEEDGLSSVIKELSDNTLDYTQLTGGFKNISALTQEQKESYYTLFKKSLVSEKMKSLDRFKKKNALGVYSNKDASNLSNFYEFDLDKFYRGYLIPIMRTTVLVEELVNSKPIFMGMDSFKKVYSITGSININTMLNAPEEFALFYDKIQEFRYDVRLSVLKRSADSYLKKLVGLFKVVLDHSKTVYSVSQYANLSVSGNLTYDYFIDLVGFESRLKEVGFSGKTGLKFRSEIEPYLKTRVDEELQESKLNQSEYLKLRDSAVNDIQSYINTQYFTLENGEKISAALSSIKNTFSEVGSEISSVLSKYNSKFGLDSNINKVKKRAEDLRNKIMSKKGLTGTSLKLQSSALSKIGSALDYLGSGTCGDLSNGGLGFVSDNTSSYSFVCDTIRDIVSSLSGLNILDVDEFDIQKYKMTGKEVTDIKRTVRNLKNPAKLDDSELSKVVSEIANDIKEVFGDGDENILETLLYGVEEKQSEHREMTSNFRSTKIFHEFVNSVGNDPFSFLDEDPDFEWDSPDHVFKLIEKKHNWSEKMESHFFGLFNKIKGTFQNTIGGKEDARLDDIENSIITDIVFGTGYSPLSDSAIHGYSTFSHEKSVDYSDLENFDFIDVYDNIFESVTPKSELMATGRRNVPTLRKTVMQNFWSQIIDSETGELNAGKISNFEIGPYLTKSYQFKKLEKLASDSRNKVVRMANEVVSMDEKILVETGATGPRGEWNYHEKIGLTDKRKKLLQEFFNGVNAGIEKSKLIFKTIISRKIDDAVQDKREEIETMERKRSGVLSKVNKALALVTKLDSTPEVEESIEILSKIRDSYNDIEIASLSSLVNVKAQIVGDIEGRSMIHFILRSTLEDIFSGVDFVSVNSDGTVKYDPEKMKVAVLESYDKKGIVSSIVKFISSGYKGYTGDVQLVDQSELDFIIEWFESGTGTSRDKFLKSGFNDLKVWLSKHLNKWIVDVYPKASPKKSISINDIHKVYNSVRVSLGADLLTSKSKNRPRNIPVLDDKLSDLRGSDNKELVEALSIVDEPTDTVFTFDPINNYQLLQIYRRRLNPVVSALAKDTPLTNDDVNYLFTTSDRPEEGLIQFTRRYKKDESPSAGVSFLDDNNSFKLLVDELKEKTGDFENVSLLGIGNVSKTTGNEELQRFVESVVGKDVQEDLNSYIREQVVGGDEGILVSILSEIESGEILLQGVEEDLVNLETLLRSKYRQDFKSLQTNYKTLADLRGNIKSEDMKQLKDLESQHKEKIATYNSSLPEYSKMLSSLILGRREVIEYYKNGLRKFVMSLSLATEKGSMTKELRTLKETIRSLPKIPKLDMNPDTYFSFPVIGSVVGNIDLETSLSSAEDEKLRDFFREVWPTMENILQMSNSIVQNKTYFLNTKDVKLEYNDFSNFMDDVSDIINMPLRENLRVAGDILRDIAELENKSATLISMSMLASEKKNSQDLSITEEIKTLLSQKEALLGEMQSLLSSTEDIPVQSIEKLDKKLSDINSQIRLEIESMSGVVAQKTAIEEIKKTRFSNNGNLNKFAKVMRSVQSRILSIDSENAKLYKQVIKTESFIRSSENDFESLGAVVMDSGKIKTWAMDLSNYVSKLSSIKSSIELLNDKRLSTNRIEETESLMSDAESLNAEYALVSEKIADKLVDYTDFYTPNIMRMFNITVDPMNLEESKSKAIGIARREIKKIEGLRSRIDKNNFEKSKLITELRVVRQKYDEMRNRVRENDEVLFRLTEAYKKSFSVIKFNSPFVNMFLDKNSDMYDPFIGNIDRQLKAAKNSYGAIRSLMDKYLELQSKITVLGPFRSLIEEQVHKAYEVGNEQ